MSSLCLFGAVTLLIRDKRCQGQAQEWQPPQAGVALPVTGQPQHRERAPTKQTEVDVNQVSPQKATHFVVPFEQLQLPR